MNVLKPIGRALLWAIIGVVIGVALANGLGALTGALSVEEPAIALGFVLGVVGWLFGIGLWDTWGREWLGLQPIEVPHKGVGRYFAFSTDHKVIGVQYLVTLMILFGLAGLLALLIRLELLAPGKQFMDSNVYNTVMGLHGIIMIAVAVAAFMGGFSNFVLPIMIGAEDVAFPRVNALSYWVLPPVAVALIVAPLFGGFDSGWTAYPPLSVVNASGQLFFLLAFLLFGVSSILGGMNFITTIITLRAPGMKWTNMPIFAWGVFTAAMISLTATQAVAAALITVILDRVVGMSFYSAPSGGGPLLYQHLFWFYSHPAVYIMALPAFAVVLEIISHFSRKPVFGYRWVAGSFIGIVALSGIVWAHHMFTSGMHDSLHIPFMLLTEMISVPTGVVFLSALGTMWRGRIWLTTPMMFALSFVFNFLIGGLTGIYLADVPTDIHFQDTYFVVAHFHYTIMGGEIFAMLAALYYWFPKITGKMYNESLGKLHFWWVFLGFNATFLAMFYVGLQGMNRRVADYDPALGTGNMITSVFAFLLIIGFAPMFYNFTMSWIKGTKAASNPWNATTLEWQVSSPPPVENFPSMPEVLGTPYTYGQKGVAHAKFNGTNGHANGSHASGAATTAAGH